MLKESEPKTYRTPNLGLILLCFSRITDIVSGIHPIARKIIPIIPIIDDILHLLFYNKVF